MAQNYTRQSTLSDGDTITASLFNDEYNQLVNAFTYSSTSASSTGHRHDGSSGQGGNIFKIGDLDFLNKIEVDSTNNRWGFYVEVSSAAVEQIRIQDGSIVPVTTNDIDLGTSSLQFKDLYIDGTANVDSLTLTSGATVTTILDEDDLSSDSATALVTQQSVKAYVDSQVTAQDLDFQADTGGALSIDLDSETMTFTGGTGIDTSGLGNAVTFAIDSTVATLTGTQTLTNKTLTSPDVNTPDIDGGTIDGTVIGGTTPAAVSATTVSATGNITVGGTVDGRDVATDGTKLDGIESGATADQTAAEIRTLVEAATDSNVFTDADHTKLDGIEAGATGDQTNAEIRAAVEAATDSNVFTDADHSKLDGIEALADVTDTTNVTAAGALMDSELTNITAVKALDQGVATTDTPTFAGLATSANVTFGDNDKAIFGAGSDLQIYHDGFNSYISDTGIGDLYIKGSTYVAIQDASGNNTFAGQAGGASYLYYAGSGKLATTSTGIDVTGTVTADGLTVANTAVVAGDFDGGTAATYIRLQDDTDNFLFGSNNSLGNFLIKNETADALRLSVANTGDISFYEDTGTTAKLFWDASTERLGLNTTTPQAGIQVAVGSSTIPSAGSSGSSAVFGNATSGSAYGLALGANSSGVGYISAQRTDGTATTYNLAIQPNGGNVGIGTSSPSSFYSGARQLVVGSGSGEQGITIYGGNTDTSYLLFADGTSGSSLYAGQVRYNHSDNSLQFATNNVSTERMRIDSSGRVSIANTVASSMDAGADNLVIGSGSGTEGMTIYSGTANSGTIYFADGSSGDDRFRGQINYDHSNNSLNFRTNASSSANMTIDASGNLLVGGTSAFGADTITLGTGGFAGIRNTSGSCLELRRDTTDGTILDFLKDGTSVGSIGTLSGYITIGRDDTAIVFQSAEDNIQPFNQTTNSGRDAAIDLGKDTVRFKDLYLSGGAYLGGTGSANHLDDYEEGTWIPTLTATTTAPTGISYTYRSGSYTKIGNVVYIRFGFLLSNVTTAGSGEFKLTGLPFTSLNNGAYQEPNFAVKGGGFATTATATNGVFGFFVNSQSHIQFRISDNSDTVLPSSEMTSSLFMGGEGFYFVS